MQGEKVGKSRGISSFLETGHSENGPSSSFCLKTRLWGRNGKNFIKKSLIFLVNRKVVLLQILLVLAL